MAIEYVNAEVGGTKIVTPRKGVREDVSAPPKNAGNPGVSGKKGAAARRREKAKK